MKIYCDDYEKAKRNIEAVCGGGNYELEDAVINLTTDGRDIFLERCNFSPKCRVIHKYAVFVLDDRIELAAYGIMPRVINFLLILTVCLISVIQAADCIIKTAFISDVPRWTIIIPLLFAAGMLAAAYCLFIHVELRPQREIREFMQRVVIDPCLLRKNKFRKDKIGFDKIKIYLDDYEQAKINIRVSCSLGKQKINNRFGKIYHKGRDDYFEFGERIHRTSFVWRIFVLNDRVELVLENIHKFLIPELFIIAILAVLQSLMFCFYPYVLNMASNDSTWIAAFVITILLNIAVIVFYLRCLYKNYVIVFKEAAAYITAVFEKKYTLK